MDKYICSDCGAKFISKEDETECPYCGSEDITHITSI